jgi:hypothetical protein
MLLSLKAADSTACCIIIDAVEAPRTYAAVPLGKRRSLSLVKTEAVEAEGESDDSASCSSTRSMTSSSCSDTNVTNKAANVTGCSMELSSNSGSSLPEIGTIGSGDIDGLAGCELPTPPPLAGKILDPLEERCITTCNISLREGVAIAKKKRRRLRAHLVHGGPVTCDCDSEKSCRNTRCPCVKQSGECSASCSCVDCCVNPFRVMAECGVDVARLRANGGDDCLLMNLSKIKNMRAKLKTQVVMDCCGLGLSLAEAVLGATCSKCGEAYSYSWCRGRLCSVKRAPRNHCKTCGHCGDHRNVHCALCGVCYLAPGARKKGSGMHECKGIIAPSLGLALPIYSSSAIALSGCPTDSPGDAMALPPQSSQPERLGSDDMRSEPQLAAALMGLLARSSAVSCARIILAGAARTAPAAARLAAGSPDGLPEPEPCEAEFELSSLSLSSPAAEPLRRRPRGRGRAVPKSSRSGDAARRSPSRAAADSLGAGGASTACADLLCDHDDGEGAVVDTLIDYLGAAERCPGRPGALALAFDSVASCVTSSGILSTTLWSQLDAPPPAVNTASPAPPGCCDDRSGDCGGLADHDGADDGLGDDSVALDLSQWRNSSGLSDLDMDGGELLLALDNSWPQQDDAGPA